MMHDISESDWKVFKKLHLVAMERFFHRATNEMRALLDIDGTPARDQFWDILKVGNERTKLAATLFDDSSRSRALMMLAGMAHHKLVTEEEMASLSQKARQSILSILDLAQDT